MEKSKIGRGVFILFLLKVFFFEGRVELREVESGREGGICRDVGIGGEGWISGEGGISGEEGGIGGEKGGIGREGGIGVL